MKHVQLGKNHSLTDRPVSAVPRGATVALEYVPIVALWAVRFTAARVGPLCATRVVKDSNQTTRELLVCHAQPAFIALMANVLLVLLVL